MSLAMKRSVSTVRCRRNSWLCALSALACLAVTGCGGQQHRLNNRSSCITWNSASKREKQAYAKTRTFPSSELRGRSVVAYIDATCNLPTAQHLGGIL